MRNRDMRSQRERHVPMSFASNDACSSTGQHSRPSHANHRQGSLPELSIREQLDVEMKQMEADLERFRIDKEARKNQSHFERQAQNIVRSDQEHKSKVEKINERSNHHRDLQPKFATMSDQQKDSSASTPSSLINDPLIGMANATNRATTTERRTTTTTTTKRTVKSSDDFIPTATDIQQVRSESRTGSISSSSPLFGSSAPMGGNSTQSSSSTTTHHSSTTGSTVGGINRQTTSGLQSPLIQDTEEGKLLKLRFDVAQYEPDEIVVKTVDNRLTVHAKHEEKSENRSVYREYNREFHLPDGTDVEQIRSSLSSDGILTVDCPLPSLQLRGASRTIPVEKV